MRQHYVKGIGNAQFRINPRCAHLLDDPDADKTKARVLENLERIEEQYAQIPVDELAKNDDFHTFPIYRDLLSNYVQLVRNLLEEPNKFTLDMISSVQHALNEVGKLYEERLISKIKELQKHRSYEKFHITITDYRGYTFPMGCPEEI